MSFSPKNVSQLLVATTDVTNLAGFNGASAIGDYYVNVIAAPAQTGTGVNFKTNASAQLVVRTAGGIKFSEVIKQGQLDSYVESTLEAGVLGVTVFSAFPAIVANTVYQVTIVVNDGIGSHLNERFINAYVNVDADSNFTNALGAKVAATIASVITELDSQLAATVLQQGSEFTITSDATTLTITGKPATHRIGATDGIPNPFSARAAVISAGGGREAITATVTEPKIDDLVQLKNIEYFNSGYGKDPYRIADALSSFAADSEVSAAGIAIGDLIGVYQYHLDRDDLSNIERQPRQLIVVGEAAETAHSAIATALGAVTVAV